MYFRCSGNESVHYYQIAF